MGPDCFRLVRSSLLLLVSCFAVKRKKLRRQKGGKGEGSKDKDPACEEEGEGEKEEEEEMEAEESGDVKATSSERSDLQTSCECRSELLGSCPVVCGKWYFSMYIWVMLIVMGCHVWYYVAVYLLTLQQKE